MMQMTGSHERQQSELFMTESVFEHAIYVTKGCDWLVFRTG